MRLTCPNCGAEYEVPDGMVPPAGRHVQCTSCHTRWFVRGGARPALSEDQILQRLENRAPRPRPVAVPAAPPEASERAAARETEAVQPVTVLFPEEEELAEVPAPQAPEEVAGPRHADPAKPAERPTIPQPGPLTEAASPLAPRPSPRLELGRRTPPVANDPSPPRGRFGRGLFLVLLVFVVALAVYVYRGPLAARLPAAAPALEAYGTQVDHLREAIESRMGKYRGA